MSSRPFVLFLLAAVSTASTCDSNVGDGGTRSRETIRVSVDFGGREGSGDSEKGSISSDGRYVAFQSASENLIEPDGNTYVDIFLKDRLTGELRNLTRLNPTIIFGTNLSSNTHLDDALDPQVTPLGRVAFRSRGKFDQTIGMPVGVPGPTVNAWVHGPGPGPSWNTWRDVIRMEVYGWPDRDVTEISISDDGRWVCLVTAASNVGVANPGFIPQVWLVDLEPLLPVPILVSRNASGGVGNAASMSARISRDGRFVVFLSNATNLSSASTPQVYLYDVQNGGPSVASVLPGTSTPAAGEFAFPAISGDGRYVAFYAKGSAIVPVPFPNQVWLTRVDRSTGTAENITNIADFNPLSFPSGSPFSVANDGTLVYRTYGGTPQIYAQKEPGNGDVLSLSSAGTFSAQGCQTPLITPDGRWALFDTVGHNLAGDDHNTAKDVFVVGPLK